MESIMLKQDVGIQGVGLGTVLSPLATSTEWHTHGHAHAVPQNKSIFPSSCNIQLREQEPCHPIKLQKDLNSAVWLVHTVDVVATGSCKNLIKHCSRAEQQSSLGTRLFVGSGSRLFVGSGSKLFVGSGSRLFVGSGSRLFVGSGSKTSSKVAERATENDDKNFSRLCGGTKCLHCITTFPHILPPNMKLSWRNSSVCNPPTYPFHHMKECIVEKCALGRLHTELFYATIPTLLPYSDALQSLPTSR